MSSMEENEDILEMEEEEFTLPASLITFHKGEGKPWDSKLGGCPYLHQQEEYPMGQNGTPMLFLAQINLKDIHNIPELPCQGLLQFFVENSAHFGIDAPPVVRWIETVTEAEDALLLKHPFADKAYQKALPYQSAGTLTFTPAEGEEEESGEDSRVGGYPFFPQDGELEENEFLLLQLADEGVCGIGFGDCGVCHFVIDRDDLAARDFSQVSYNWDCC